MGVFKPGMFGRRRIHPDDAPAPREPDAPPPEPAECPVCNVPGHTRDACWTAITPANVERTWQGAKWSNGEGDSFRAAKEWWDRVRR